MADRTFPRANLNPSAAPWARAIERAILDLLTQSDQADGRADGTRTSAVRALRRVGVDPTIYRHDGVLAPPDQDEFSIARTGNGPDDTDGVASFNLQPGVALMRGTAPADGDIPEQTTFFEVRPDFAQLGAGPGLRRDDFEGRGAGFVYRLDDNGLPLMQLALYDAPALEIGFELSTNGTRAYLQMNGDESTRVYAIGDGSGSSGGGGTVPNADHTTAGLVRLATATEAAAGTDDSTAVTPKGLKAAQGQQGWRFRGDWAAA